VTSTERVTNFVGADKSGATENENAHGFHGFLCQ